MNHTQRANTRRRTLAQAPSVLAAAAVAGVLVLSACGTSEPKASQPPPAAERSPQEVAPGAESGSPTSAPDETIDQDVPFYESWTAEALLEQERHDATMAVIDNLGPTDRSCASQGGYLSFC